MRSAGPTGHHVGAQGRNEVDRSDATRMRGQFRPEMTLRAGDGQCPDGGADVVLDLTTLPLTPDGEDGSGQQFADPLHQFLIWHAKNLQLPIARSYLLLERTLRLIDQGRHLDFDPLRQQGAEHGRQVSHRGFSLVGRPQADVEILAT
jgi:hypothetical protein